MTLVKDISPTGIKAMRERISAEVKLAHRFSRMAVQKRQWASLADTADRPITAAKWRNVAAVYRTKRDDHMDAARRCKWELTQVEEAERH